MLTLASKISRARDVSYGAMNRMEELLTVAPRTTNNAKRRAVKRYEKSVYQLIVLENLHARKQQQN